MQIRLVSRLATAFQNNLLNISRINTRFTANRLCTFTDPDMELKTVTRKLNSIAPTSLAGSWDNVGLLVEPTPPHEVKSMLLTNDLTEIVLKEALDKQVNFILSYHPPIFSPLKRLTQRTWKERIIVQCLENRIAVYSPHTSYDAVKGGVNDWLLKPFSGVSKPIEKVTAPQYAGPGGYCMSLTLPHSVMETTQQILEALPSIAGVTVMSHVKLGSDEPAAVRLGLNCTEEGLSRAVDFVNQFEDIRETIEIVQLTKPPIPHHGPGRIMTLESKMSVQSIVDKVKTHLDLEHVRLALATNTTLESSVKKIAVCAGSGSSVLRGVCADLYLTGEMSHHEVLDANHRDTSVILCDHSNTERGYFKDHKATLESLLNNKVQVLISETDRDPLVVM